MRPPRPIRWFRGLLVLTSIGGLAVGAFAWWVAGELIAPANHKVHWPEDFPAETVSIPGDGHAIAGSWRDFGGDSPVVLLVHGIRADRASMLPHARLLVRGGFSVLMIDLQAHGETPGENITLGWRESADVRAARDWIRAHAPGRRVGVIGTSLGGAAVLLGGQPAGFDAVVLEAVYPRLARAVENRIRLRVGPFAPALTPLLLAQVGPRLHVKVEDLEPIRSIGALGAPLLVVGGSDDERTTENETRELYEAAGEDAGLWIVEGAAHQDLALFNPVGYQENVGHFLHKYLGRPQDPATLARIADALDAASPDLRPHEPSTAVLFFAEGLDRPLVEALRLSRLAKLCVEKYRQECEQTGGLDPAMAQRFNEYLQLGPLFAKSFAQVRPPEVANFQELRRDAARAVSAARRAAQVYDRELITRLAAVILACPSERSGSRRADLNGLATLNYARIEQISEQEYGVLMGEINNDAGHIAERLRAEWLGTTCTSADELSGYLMAALARKVHPFADGAPPDPELNRFGLEMGYLWGVAYALARDGDPAVEQRVRAIDASLAPGTAPSAEPHTRAAD